MYPLAHSYPSSIVAEQFDDPLSPDDSLDDERTTESSDAVAAAPTSMDVADACVMRAGLVMLGSRGGTMPLGIFVELLAETLAASGAPTTVNGNVVRTLLGRINGRLRVGQLPQWPGIELVYDSQRWAPASDYFVG